MRIDTPQTPKALMKTPRPRPCLRQLCLMIFLLAGLAGSSLARADMSPPASGPAPGVTPEEQAREAGAAAGFAAECGADTAAIHGAFESYLTRQGLSDSERDALRRQFSRAETTTIIPRLPAPRCAEMHEVELQRSIAWRSVHCRRRRCRDPLSAVMVGEADHPRVCSSCDSPLRLARAARLHGMGRGGIPEITEEKGR